MSKNAADATQVKKDEDRQKQGRDRDLSDLRSVMSTREGRRVMNRLIEFCGVMSTGFNPNGSITNFNLGQRNVGLKLYADLEEGCPQSYLLMRQEARRSEE